MNISLANVDNSRGSSTDIAHGNASISIDIGKNASRRRGHRKKTTNSDNGPKRGNRAAALPQRLSTPDVETYLEHLANHASGFGTETSLSQQLSRESTLGTNGRGFIFRPQYAARSHGEMAQALFRNPSTINEDHANNAADCIYHGTVITKEFWVELTKENSVQRIAQRSRLCIAKEALARRRVSVVGDEVLRRALKDRANSGVNY
jgi:hypothetical protein